MATKMRAIRLARFSALLFILAAAPACRATDYAHWQAHRDALAKDPSVLRLYTFEEKSGDTLHNGVGRDGYGDMAIATNPHYSRSWPLWTARDYPAWSAGRWPGKGALNFGMATRGVYLSHFYASRDNHFTVELWIRPWRPAGDRTVQDYCYIDNTITSGWKISGGPGFTYFQLSRPPGKGPGQGSVAVFGPRLTEHVWHQVVAELDGDTVSLFIDGKLAAGKQFDGIYNQPAMSDKWSRIPELDPSGFVLGNRSAPESTNPATPRFDMDEAVIFGRALSANEVAAEFAAGSPDETPESQLAAHQAYLARQTLLDSIDISIPTDSFGYFTAGQAFATTISIPNTAALAGPFAVSASLTDLSGAAVNEQKRSTTGAAITIPVVLPKCGLYWLKVTVRDAAGAVLRENTFPIAGVIALQPAADVPATSPLAGHGIVQTHPADMVLGARADRMIAPFLNILHDGSYNWKIPDDCVNAANKNGLEVLYTIYPPFNMPRNSPQELARDPDRWSAWVRDLVTHFKGRVHIWEIWNEPNAVPGFSATDYVVLLKSAYAAIHQVDPSATVLGGCGVYTIPQWTEAVLAAGGGPYMDVLSIHNYIGGSPIGYRNQFQKLRQVRELIGKYVGHPLPVWNSEGGIHQPARIDGKMVTDEQILKIYGSRASSHDGCVTAGVDAILMTTEHRSACWNVQSILMDLADGDARYFTLMGAGTFYPFKSSSEGLPTEKGIAYAAMASVVGRSKSIGWIPLDSSRAAGIGITEQSGKHDAVFFSDTPLELTFEARPGQVFQGMDYLGNPLSWTAAPAGLTLRIGQEPITLFDLPAGFSERHLLSAADFPKVLLPGQIVRGTLTVDAAGSHSINFDSVAHTVTSGSLTLDRNGARLAQGKWTIPFTCTADAASHGSQNIVFTLNTDGKPVSRLEIPFYAEGPAVQVSRLAAPVALDGNTAVWAGLPAETANQIGNVAIGKPDVGFENKNTWQGPADCSFTVKTAWRNGDGLYFQVDVTDDAFHPTPPGNNQPWLWDGLELFVDTRAADNRTASISPGAQQVMVVPNAGTTAAPCRTLNLAGTKATVDVVCTSRQTDGGYLIEGKITPKNGGGWEMKPGSRIGLDFAVDDNDDGVKRKSQLVLHGAANDSVDTSGWGQYELSDGG